MSRRHLCFRAVSLLVIAALLISLLPVYPAHAEGVTFADSKVEKVVRLKLAKPSGALTEEDLAKLKELTIPDYSGVKSLKGLEKAVNLTSLTSWGNQITDLSPLSGLKQLKELNLNENQVTNLSPLAGLTELRSLLISQNQIKDIRPLAGLVKLTELSLSQNPITDLSILSGLTELTELSFDDTPISDLTPIRGLAKLRILSFFDSKVENLEPLKALTSLEYLTMRDNRVSDLTPIVELPNLKEVQASNNYLDLNDPATKAAIESLKARKVALSGFFGSIQEQKTLTTHLKLKWSLLDELHTGITKSIASGGGLYVMPASGGYVKTSKDGLTWKQTYSGNPQDFSFIIRGKTDFMGFREAGRTTTVWTSKDGVAWKQTAKTIPTPYIWGAVWNGKRYVAVGGEYSKGMIYSSEDGITWTERKTGIGTNFTAVAWGNNTFVAQGYEDGVVAVSKDGVTWKKVSTKQPNYEQVWDMTFGGGAFVAVGDATIMTSKDGEKWTYVSSNVFWSDVYWAKDRFYAYGFVYADKANHVLKLVNWTSKDGKSWSDAGFVASPKQNPYATFHNGKQYVTITDSGIEASTDGRSWKQTLLYPFQLPRNVYGAAAGSDKLAMVGGYRDSYHAYLSISFQGSAQMNTAGKWKSATVGQTYPLRSVVWSGKDFFAVGDNGKMMSSTDGLKWTAVKSPTSATLLSVLYVKGTYYAAGEGGVILSSKDRKTWTTLKTNVKKKINSLASNGTTLVAVGEEGLLLVSKDGVKWSQITALFPGDNFDVAWGNGQFVVTTASYYGNAKSAVILTSSDGVKWKTSTFPDGLTAHGMGTGLFGISYIGGLFVAVGSEGTVFLSEDAKQWTQQDVFTIDDWYDAVEFQGKVYLFGNTGKIVTADLKSLERKTEKGE
ncbi:leucine-rich repeat domain-containing protein [Gorillibacterium timonense]|uniref:leucine-rich repeat domain-containing protein n=1 Tax=Gorillibacterium timonense TaxID=1689269 RepID=UPI00071CBBF8|nr:leucine-rich repeat domain-containing protein [Gorillibacterium timonense]